jgi:hypothetical protein
MEYTSTSAVKAFVVLINIDSPNGSSGQIKPGKLLRLIIIVYEKEFCLVILAESCTIRD